jgi:hypothetical protein
MITLKGHYIISLFLFLSIQAQSQSQFGLSVNVGSITSTAYEYSDDEIFVKGRWALNPIINFGATYQRKKSMFSLSYLFYTQEVAFEISGVPNFRKNEGFGRISYPISINAMELNYAREIYHKGGDKFYLSLGVGSNFELSLKNSLSLEDQIVVKEIRNVNTTLNYSLFLSTGLYVRIPYISTGLTWSRRINKRSDLSFSLRTFLDANPIGAYEVNYSFKHPVSMNTVNGDRIIIMDAKRIALTIGYQVRLFK